MKKVLVTGAAGTIGLQVIKYLLSEGKYEITALDLKNNKSKENLKKYKKRINVILGDVTDRVLMEALVKDFDFIIHLAGVMPPLANLKKDLANEIDYKGSENIIRAINYYNPKCHLFYPSTMLLDSKKNKDIDNYNYYLVTKQKCENLIKEKLKYYTIYRFPLVLSLVKDSLILNLAKNEKVYWITKEDAAYSLVKGIEKPKELNKKIYNVTNQEPVVYAEILNHILEDYGLNKKYIFYRFMVDKYFTFNKCANTEELNDLISYRNDTLTDYYNRLKVKGKNRKIGKFLGKFFISRGYK